MLCWVSSYGFIDCPSKGGQNVSVPTLYPFIFRISDLGAENAISAYIFVILCVTVRNTKNMFSILGSGTENVQNSFWKIGGGVSGPKTKWLFNFLLEADEAFEAFLVELLKPQVQLFNDLLEAGIRGLSSGAPLSQSASSRPIRSLALFHKNPLTQ